MTTKSYPLRISEDILAISDLRAEDEHLDRSTALRQFLHIGAEEYVLELVEDGRISIGRAAELLQTTIYDIQRIAKKHGVPLSSTPEQAKKSRETTNRLFR